MYQLIARATYLPEDYLRLRHRCQLIAKATYLRLRLRHQLIARAIYLPKSYLRLRLRCQLTARATYLRCATVHQASVSVGRVKRPVFAALRLAHSAVREKTELRGASGGAIISL